MYRRRLIMLSAAVVACFGLLNTGSGQSLTIKTDNVRINGGKADFGSGTHNGGGAGDGTVTWNLLTANNSLAVTARVRGVLYWDATDEGCAALTIRFLNGSSQPASGNSSRFKQVCGPGGNANDQRNQVSVDETFTGIDLRSVAISTQDCKASGLLCSASGRSIGGIKYQYDDNTVKIDGPPDLKKYDVNINNGSTDFGNGLHAFGGPTGSGSVTLKYDSAGKVTGIVSGTVYWDDLLSSGCAQLEIDFEAANLIVLDTRKIHVCGTGGNANDQQNKIALLERVIDGSLMQIRLTVLTLLSDGRVTKGKTILCNFKECR